jgi:hypothetical protein
VFFTAIAGSLAGAFAEARAAQGIADKTRNKDELFATRVYKPDFSNAADTDLMPSQSDYADWLFAVVNSDAGGLMSNAHRRRVLMPTVRHECGHLLVARNLGFATGDIQLRENTAGAGIDLVLSLRNIEEILTYLEKRIQVLFAGALAESIRGGQIQPDVAFNLLNSPTASAGHDFAKIKELLRLCVGLRYPNATEKEFGDRLTELKDRLYNDVGPFIEANVSLIDKLALFFLDELEKSNGGLMSKIFDLPKASIDAFLASNIDEQSVVVEVAPNPQPAARRYERLNDIVTKALKLMRKQKRMND